MVPTRNWIATEYCSGLICASLIHLKPLIERLLPGLLGVSRVELTKSRLTTRRPTRTDGLALESRATWKRKLDPFVHLNTTAIRANTVAEDETFGAGIRITRDFIITSEPYPRLSVPNKVLQRYRTTVGPRAGLISPPPSSV